MSRWIKSYDILSPQTSLYFEGQRRYFSLVGMTMTILYISAVVTMGVYFFVCFVKGEQIYLISSKETKETYLSGNMTEKILLYSLNDVHGDFVDPRIIETIATFWTVTSNGSNYERLVETPCPKNYQKKHLLDFDPSKYKCISRKNNEDIILNSCKSPLLREYVTIYVTKCKNTTENGNHCFPEEEIERQIKDGNFYFIFFGEAIFIDNRQRKPIIPVPHTESLQISNDFIYFYSYHMRKIEYTSDEGIILTNKKHYEDVGFDTEYYFHKVFPKDKKFIFEETVLVFQLDITHTFVDKYQRSYQKFSSFAANVGGIDSVLYFIGQTITIFLSRGGILLSLSDVIIDKKGKMRLSLYNVRETLEARSGNEWKNKINITSVQRSISEINKLKRKFSFVDTVFYRCLKKRKKCNYIAKFEEKLQELLDIKNLMILFKDMNNCKMDTTITHHKNESTIFELFKEHQKIRKYSDDYGDLRQSMVHQIKCKF